MQSHKIRQFCTITVIPIERELEPDVIAHHLIAVAGGYDARSLLAMLPFAYRIFHRNYSVPHPRAILCFGNPPRPHADHNENSKNRESHCPLLFHFWPSSVLAVEITLSHVSSALFSISSSVSPWSRWSNANTSLTPTGARPLTKPSMLIASYKGPVGVLNSHLL